MRISITEDEVNKLKRTINNDNLIIETLAQWVKVEHEGNDISKLLLKLGYKKLAIYGYGHIGRLLENTLKNSGLIIECIFDQKFSGDDSYFRDIKCSFKLNVDLFIVTVPLYYEEIKQKIIEDGFVGEVRLIDDFLFQL